MRKSIWGSNAGSVELARFASSAHAARCTPPSTRPRPSADQRSVLLCHPLERRSPAAADQQAAATGSGRRSVQGGARWASRSPSCSAGEEPHGLAAVQQQAAAGRCGHRFTDLPRFPRPLQALLQEGDADPDGVWAAGPQHSTPRGGTVMPATGSHCAALPQPCPRPSCPCRWVSTPLVKPPSCIS